jgi:DNA-binding CsgD family transcriptional regulator
MDPFIPTVLAASTGTMFTDTMMIPKAAMERTEFYQDWVRPQGYYSALGANVIREGTSVGVTVLSRRREEDDFQRDDLDLLATLVPHLKRAVRVQWRLEGLRSERKDLMDALDRLTHGIVVTDRSYRIIFANRAAEEIVAQHDGIGFGPMGLRAAKTAQTSELRRLVARAAGADQRIPAGGALLVDRPSMRAAFQVLISPLRAEIGWVGMAWRRPAVLVLIIDPERAPVGLENHLRTLFKLTRTEARVACAVATGEGLIGVADSLGMLPSTARTHLHRVFEKTETQRQAELVKLVERMAALRIGNL